MKIKATLFLSLLLIAGICQAQKLPAGPQVLTFFSDADDTEQPYGLYLPKNYDENKKYPLVIMLHGAGSNHRLALRRVFGKSNANGETDVEATRYFPEWKDIEYIVASPYARGTAGYQGIPEKDVYDVLADVKKRFNVDEDRTYLTGLSMGGGGTLWIGMTRPDIWAAIAPVCPAPPQGTDQLIENALNLPAHFYHGDKDSAVPVTVSRDWTTKLKAMGAQVEYDEYPGVNHDSWVNAYKDEAVFGWFDKFKRNLYPDRVTYNANQYKYNKAYWVTFDRILPGTLAKIDARYVSPNQLEVTTTSLDAFTLSLKNHPKYQSGKPLTVTVDGKKIKTETSDAISFTKKDGKWTNTKTELKAEGKNQKLEGPIKETFASRHIYVYGTAGNPSQEELKKRADVATEAANWSFYRGAFLNRIMFFPRIVADKDVRPADLESCNMILFGTTQTNLLIEKYKDKLPLQLDDSKASDHGLFYVYPIDGHYIAVSSGLPWWANSQSQNYRFPPSLSEVPNLKDFVLFKNSIKEVVADGYFDNDWKLSADSKSKLSAGGAIAK